MISAEYFVMNNLCMCGCIVVIEPTDYDNLLSVNVNQQSASTSGQQLYQSLGCVSCHGANAEGGRGPALLGVYGSNVVLSGGQSVTADEAYIRESILNPQAKIVAGFGPIMPSFQGQVNEEQLLQLVAYINFLSTAKPETRTTKPAGLGPS